MSDTGRLLQQIKNLEDRLQQHVRRLAREADASPWRTGTPTESGRYLIVRRFPRPPRVDYWEVADSGWSETPAEDVLAWMPVPKWEGER